MRHLLLALVLLAACGDNLTDHAAPDGGAQGTAGKAVVVAGDFQSTGVLSTVDGATLTVTPNAVAGVAGSDPVVRRIDGELFVVNRFGGDNVTVLDAATLALKDQFGTGAGSNPQDVAVAGGKLYVAALAAPGIVVIDRAHPEDVSMIDLSSLDSFDHVPDCETIYPVGDRLYAVCGLLQEFSPVVDAKLVVIDPAHDSVVTTIDLPSMNPTTWLEPAADGRLLVSLVPSFTDLSSGCLAAITTGDAPSATCLMSNQSLGGFVNRIAGDWAIVSAYDAQFNPSKGALVHLAAGAASASYSPHAQLLKDVARCGDYLFVTDKATGAEGVRVYRASGDAASELTQTPLDIGLPPGFGNGVACMAQ